MISKRKEHELKLIEHNKLHMILLGFRYPASSIPSISLAGVAVGVGIIFASLVFSISRNPTISNTLIR